MPLRVGVVKYASVGSAIARALGVDPSPEVYLGQRITLTFRRLGATRWDEAQQTDFALRIAAVAREVLASDSRRAIRGRSKTRAIVVVFEDARLDHGCSVLARWECVVPAP